MRLETTKCFLSSPFYDFNCFYKWQFVTFGKLQSSQEISKRKHSKKSLLWFILMPFRAAGMIIKVILIFPILQDKEQRDPDSSAGEIRSFLRAPNAKVSKTKWNSLSVFSTGGEKASEGEKDVGDDQVKSYCGIRPPNSHMKVKKNLYFVTVEPVWAPSKGRGKSVIPAGW